MGNHKLVGGRVIDQYLGFRVREIYDGEKKTGKYGIYAGDHLVSDPKSKKESIELMRSSDFKPKDHKKKK